MKDKELLILIRQDPDRGIAIAMDQYGRAVNTICKSMLRAAPDGVIDEVVSDTFFKLWKNSEKIQVDKADACSLKSYLYSIARNTAIDRWRKEKPQMQAQSLEQQEWLALDAGYNVEGEVQERLLTDTMHQVIHELGEPDHTVFLLKYFLGMRNAEIASQLMLKTKKVENILFRGKRRLKQLLAERGIASYEER